MGVVGPFPLNPQLSRPFGHRIWVSLAHFPCIYNCRVLMDIGNGCRWPISTIHRFFTFLRLLPATDTLSMITSIYVNMCEYVHMVTAITLVSIYGLYGLA